MEEGVPKFYDTCSQCRYAQFLDFETVLCSKSVVFEPDTECGEYEGFPEKKEKVGSNLLDVAEEIEEILVKEEEQIIEELKKVEPSEVVAIKKSPLAIDAPSKKKFSIHTKKKCYVYSNTKTKPEHIIRTEPANKLIPFHRNVIRNGQDFIMLKEPNGDKAYIRYDEKNLIICSLALAKEHPLDILLMSHEVFDQSIASTKVTYQLIKDSFSGYLNSLVETKRGVTHVKIKDVFRKDGKEVSAMNEFSFNKKIDDLKIGQLEPYAVFHIVEKGKTDQHARKIKLPDGTEAILLSRTDAYSEIETNIEEFVSTLSKLLFVAILIIGTVLILVQTGWLVFFGIVMIPLAFIIIVFFSLPLHFVLSQIVKRF